MQGRVISRSSDGAVAALRCHYKSLGAALAELSVDAQSVVLCVDLHWADLPHLSLAYLLLRLLLAQHSFLFHSVLLLSASLEL